MKYLLDTNACIVYLNDPQSPVRQVRKLVSQGRPPLPHIRKQVIELKRERLAQRAEEARENFEKGEVETGALKDLMEDLDRD